MARFLKKSKTLFQHIPRTGGTWVQDSLDFLEIDVSRWVQQQPEGLPRKHALLSHYYPSSRSRYVRAFTFVREPAALYESIWTWLRDAEQSGRGWCIEKGWHPKKYLAQLWKPDFSEWVEAVLEREPYYVSRLYEWYVGPEGGEFCFYVGRTETLADDLADALRRLGYVVNADALRRLPRKNASAGSRPRWDRVLLDRMRRAERLAYRRFYDGSAVDRRLFGNF